jgi:phosphoglycolate phosphatase
MFYLPVHNVPVVNGRRYLAVGFDMDNTLLRTDVDYSKICDVVCSEMGRAGVPDDVLDVNESSKFNLDSGVGYLERNGRSDEIYEIMETVKEKVKAVELRNVLVSTQYEGGERMISYLKEKGYRIGVLTRGSREYATKALTVAGVIDKLDALVCRDDHDESEAKPSPAAMAHLAAGLGVRTSDILYLGDHKMDLFCARDSGAGFIGVLTRYTKDDWKDVDKNIVMIDTVADLVDIL